MNIAINIDGQFGKMTGVQFYVDSLIAALYDMDLPHEITAFMPAVWSPSLWQEAAANGGFAWLTHPRAHVDTAGSDCYLQSQTAVKRLSEHSPARAGARLLDRRLIHPVKSRLTRVAEWRARAAACRYDVLHTPGMARTESATYHGRRTVATIHDLTSLTYAWTHRPANIAMADLLYDYARRSDRVVTISEHTKRDVVEHLGISADRIDVTPLAPRSSTRRVSDPLEIGPVLDKFGLASAPFVLYGGTLEPRKNLPRLLAAFAQTVAEARLPEHRLALAGGKWGDHDQELRKTARELGIEDRVVFTGYVSNDEMNALMSSCAVFAYVSEYEGFGLPPLEAMVCGAPVLSSDASSLPEVVGEAGLQVAPTDVEGMAAALSLLLTDCDENARRRALSLAQAQKFDWTNTAALTLQAYERAAA